MFFSSQTWKRDPSVAFLCQGWPCPLPTTFYHPDTVSGTLYCPDVKNTTMWSRSSRLGYSPNIPLTQTWRTQPLCRVLHVWPTIASLWIQKHDPLGCVFPVHSFLINIFNVLGSKIKIMSFFLKINLRFRLQPLGTDQIPSTQFPLGIRSEPLGTTWIPSGN